ncbi:DNA-binding transcriptional MerR regulator [Promicromonospora sp. AC04]|uniref:DNA polymerase III subunit beta family protein n=1 Tax=Promicromonospora sp. AC04 TaxID=2135723 RepID=UPI000D3AB252|nr:MerR family transcriptional regulator [Promicromonospora sp. AC04]PUB22241.1 DNA-binding transcriptional MerR regulator [Promicromonospora sp. AC04]
MHEHLRGIGAVARESGLPVSALRFYDAVGVLRPAWSDPVTGYRWYSGDQVGQAALVARLRQVEMPLADIAEVLASRHRSAEALTVLDRHLRELESRFAAARKHLSDAREFLADPPATRLEVSAADLAQALAAVRYAVGSDPAWPALTGVLLDCSDGVLRLVACDRARLAVASVPVRHLGGLPVQVVVPLAFLASLLDRDGDGDGGGGGDSSESDAGGEEPLLSVELRVDRVVIGDAEGALVAAEPVAAEYPDYQALLQATWVRQVRIPTSDLVSRVVDGPPGSIEGRPAVTRRPDFVAVLLGDHGVDVVQPSVPGAVAFDRAYLLEALAAAGGDDVVLALDAARQVLGVARPARPEDRSLLMPVRLRP